MDDAAPPVAGIEKFVEEAVELDPIRPAGALPDKITIYRGPLERLYGHDRELLRSETKRVTLHEIAHHFGIGDQRLVDIDRY